MLTAKLPSLKDKHLAMAEEAEKKAIKVKSKALPANQGKVEHKLPTKHKK